MKTLEEFYGEIKDQLKSCPKSPMGIIQLQTHLHKTMYGLFVAKKIERAPNINDVHADINDDDGIDVSFSQAWMDEIDVQVDEAEMAICMCSSDPTIRRLAKAQWERKKRETELEEASDV